MQKFYIIDLQYNDFKIKLNDCKIIYLNSGRVDDNRSQVLKIYELFQNFNEKKVFLKALKKKIQLKNNFFFKEFEIFNVRNDKNLEISKILNYLKISNYLKKKKLLSQINLITDNQNSVNILNNITKNNIKIEYKEKIKKNKIKFLNKNFYFFKFLLIFNFDIVFCYII